MLHFNLLRLTLFHPRAVGWIHTVFEVGTVFKYWGVDGVVGWWGGDGQLQGRKAPRLLYASFATPPAALLGEFNLPGSWLSHLLRQTLANFMIPFYMRSP